MGRTPALEAIRPGPASAGSAGSPPAASAPALGLPLAPSSAAESTSTISLPAGSVQVRAGAALVRLRCRGRATCKGKLTLTVRSSGQGKHRSRARTVTIGSAGFSVAGEESKSVKIKISSAGSRPSGHGARQAGGDSLAPRARSELVPRSAPERRADQQQPRSPVASQSATASAPLARSWAVFPGPEPCTAPPARRAESAASRQCSRQRRRGYPRRVPTL